MRIVVIIASPQGKKSETGDLATVTVEQLQQIGFRTPIIYTAELTFAACGGCLACETEDECIVKDDIQKIQQQIETASGLLLASPVYLSGPPGRLKCLLDRFWPYSLRPRLFGRYAGVIVTSGSFGALNVAEYLTAIIESWGIRVLEPVTTTLLTRDASERRKKTVIESRLLGRRMAEAIQKKKRIGMSTRGKKLIRNLWGLIQDNQERFKKSYNYWQEHEITKKFGF